MNVWKVPPKVANVDEDVQRDADVKCLATYEVLEEYKRVQKSTDSLILGGLWSNWPPYIPSGLPQERTRMNGSELM